MIDEAKSKNKTEELMKPYTTVGDEKDATSLENMKKALEYIKKCNEYRVKGDNNKPAMDPLKVTDFYMAVAQINTNYSRNIEKDHSKHYGGQGSGENLAYGMYEDNNPFKGWYDEEKAKYDKENRNFSEIGHYENIMRESSKYTGFAVTTKTGTTHGIAYGQVFGSYAEGKTYTLEEYTQLFNEYYNHLKQGLEGKDPELDAKIAEAQAKINEINQRKTNKENEIATEEAKKVAKDEEINKKTNDINTKNIEKQTQEQNQAKNQENIENKNQEKTNKETEISKFKQDNEEKINNDLENAEREKTNAENEFKTASDNLNSAIDAHQKAETELENAKQKVKDASKEANDKNEELEKAKENLENKKTDLENAEKEKTNAENKLNTAKANFEARKTLRDNLQSKQNELDAEDAAKASDLENAQNAFNNFKSLSDELDRLSNEYNSAKENVSSKEKEKNDLDSEIKDLENKKQDIIANVNKTKARLELANKMDPENEDTLNGFKNTLLVLSNVKLARKQLEKVNADLEEARISQSRAEENLKLARQEHSVALANYELAKLYYSQFKDGEKENGKEIVKGNTPKTGTDIVLYKKVSIFSLGAIFALLKMKFKKLFGRNKKNRK